MHNQETLLAYLLVSDYQGVTCLDRTRIGLAMSQDGRNWARIEADHHTGALFDAGEGEDWDECLNGAPQVVCVP